METRAAPPSGLRSALRHEANKQQWVDWVFTRVADRYDLGNDLMSFGWHTRWKKRLIALAAPRRTDRVLDLACGTGDVTWMLAPHVSEVVGADINEEMLVCAEAKRPSPEIDNVRWARCDATEMPFDSESFDLVTCAYAGRGFPDWPATLAEIHRVLRPGGRFVNLDFARPPSRTWDRAYRGWMTVSGAVLGTVLHGHPKTYVYIPLSMRAYRGQRWLDAEMMKAGFTTTLEETTGCLMAFNVGTKT